MKGLLILSAVLFVRAAGAQEKATPAPRPTKAEFEAHAKADLEKELKAEDDARVSALQKKLQSIAETPAPTPSVSVPRNPTLVWEAQTTVSPIDDSMSVFVNALARDFESGREGAAMLSVRHVEGKTEVVLVQQNNILGYQDTPVIFRWDSDPARTEVWSISTDHRGLFSKNPEAFIERCLPCKKLIARVTPLGGNQVTVVFDLTSFAPVFEKYRAQFYPAGKAPHRK